MSSTPPIGLSSQHASLSSFLDRHLAGGTGALTSPCAPLPSPLPPLPNGLVFLTGFRGSGKSLLLKKSLQDARERGCQFKVVTLNGLVQTDDLGAMREVASQLSVDLGEVRVPLPRGGRDPVLRPLCSGSHTQTISSSFHDNATLVSQCLRLGRLSNEPTVIVLDELDSFASRSSAMGGGGKGGKRAKTSGNDSTFGRQTLLYTLLDAVGDPGSSIVVIGLTSRLTIMEMFEKRLRSRSSQVQIVFGKTKLEDLREIILERVYRLPSSDLSDPEDPDPIGETQFSALISSKSSDVAALIKRNHNLGKSVGWFCRLVDVAVSLCLTDFFLGEIPSKRVAPQHMLSAFNSMGVSTVGRAPAGATMSFAVGDPRLQTLLSLSPPHVVIVLAIKRVNERDIMREEAYECATFDRAYAEYDRWRRRGSQGGGGATQEKSYGKRTLFQAFLEVVEMGIVRPAFDHSGNGALQYKFGDSITELFGCGCDGIVMNIPVHLTVDLESEVNVLLRQRELKCGNAVREWGLKIN